MEEETGAARRGVVMGRRDTVKQEIARKLRRSMTRAESMLWHRLRDNRLNGLPFRRQQVIRGFIVDFYCHQAALAVELDGAVHEGQQAYDQERTRIIEELGISVLRFRNDEVETNIEAVLASISQACTTANAPRLRTPSD